MVESVTDRRRPLATVLRGVVWLILNLVLLELATRAFFAKPKRRRAGHAITTG